MQQRDYILREIEKFGKYLQILLARFTGAKPDAVRKEYDAIRLELLNELEFDIDELPLADPQTIGRLLKNNPKLGHEHLDRIGDLLGSMAASMGNGEDALKQELIKKSLMIRGYIAEKKPLYYFKKRHGLG